METSMYVELANIFAGILTGAGGVFAIVKARTGKKILKATQIWHIE